MALEWNGGIRSSSTTVVVQAGGHGIFALVMARWQGGVRNLGPFGSIGIDDMLLPFPNAPPSCDLAPFSYITGLAGQRPRAWRRRAPRVRWSAR
jgi:hypothetical protein